MLLEQFDLIYKTLLQISTFSVLFDNEKRIAKSAQRALETRDVKQMWQCLVGIALRQGLYENEKKMIDLAQSAIRQLLLELKLLDESIPTGVQETRQ